ncbi:MAG: iron uptake porin [Cyanobacteria bacterium P01_G01_bin.67]
MLLFSQVLNKNNLSQVTEVNQLIDLVPRDWAYAALRSLVERYGCLTGFPNQSFRGNQALSRYEFAAGLNYCLNQIERLVAAQQSLTRNDLETLNLLTQEFEAELTMTASRVDELGSRTGILEDNQFSATTVLRGEVILAIADTFGGEIEEIDNVSDQSETTFSSRVRLNFDTSLFGRDRLRTRLRSGNFIKIDEELTGTDSTRLGFDTGGDFDLQVSDLIYRFPVNQQLRLWVSPLGLDLDDIFNVSNPQLASSSSGALSRFSRRDPLLFRGTERAGLGINLELIKNKLRFNALYLTDNANERSNGDVPGTEAEGLFKGFFSSGAQLVYNPFDALELSATYVRNYQTADSVDQSGDTVSGFATQPFASLDGNDNTDIDTTTDKIGGTVSFNVSEKIVISGFGGFADVSGLVTGEDNNQSGEIWTWGANVSILDLITEGAKFSVAGGMLPKFISEDAVPEGQAGLQEDQDTSYLVEALYRFPLNDNVAITPGAYAVLNPNHVDDNDTVYVGVVRTTIRF